MSGFVEEFGHRQKSEVLHLRGSGERCELAVLGECRVSRDMLFMDHCHPHGFVRGWLCHAHNANLSYFEHGKYLVYGFPSNLSNDQLSAIFRYLNNCRGCDALGLHQRREMRREELRCAPVRQSQAEQLIEVILIGYELIRGIGNSMKARRELVKGNGASE